MKILVANLGSTSFKYRLFDMAGNVQLARRHRTDRLAREPLHGGDRRPAAGEDLRVPDHAEAVHQCLDPVDRSANRLPQGGVRSVGHRVQGGPRRAISGVQRVTPEVLAAMEEMSDVAPPTIRPTSRRCGCWARSCRRFRWWRPSRPTSTAPFPTATATTPCLTNGRKTA